MSKDDDLLAKAAALAPKPKRKKKAGAVLPPGGELPTWPAHATAASLPACRSQGQSGRPKKSETPKLMRNIFEQFRGL